MLITNQASQACSPGGTPVKLPTFGKKSKKKYAVQKEVVEEAVSEAIEKVQLQMQQELVEMKAQVRITFCSSSSSSVDILCLDDILSLIIITLTPTLILNPDH